MTTRRPASRGEDLTRVMSGHQECPHAPMCVGCPYYGLRYGEQLERKHRRVIDALAAHAPSLRVDVDKPVRAVERHEVPIYDERSREGWLRYVAVRSSWMRRTTQVVLVVRDRKWPGERKLVERLRRTRGIGSVVLNVNDTPGNAIFSDKFVPMTRHEALIERVGGLKLKFHPGSFVQANLSAARRAYEKVAELAALTGEETAVDLYCGVGAISLSLACTGKFVLGIESSPAAVRDAVENTRLNGIHNARFRDGPAAEILAEVADELPRVDVVTLNPPRKGAGEEAIAAIVKLQPSRVVYMSCDPDSLARDLERLATAGYSTRSVTPFDFLPQTEHVECVALAVRD